jgi:transcriptional regulator with XRE-family HTH domain
MSKILSSRLKFIRRMRGVTQQQVADAINVSRTTYSTYERGRAEPDVELLRRLSEFYKVSADFLLQIDIKSEDPVLDDLRARLWEHILVSDRETAEMILNLFGKFGKN